MLFMIRGVTTPAGLLAADYFQNSGLSSAVGVVERSFVTKKVIRVAMVTNNYLPKGDI